LVPQYRQLHLWKSTAYQFLFHLPNVPHFLLHIAFIRHI
jgi:hypothetical protein